MNFRLYLRPINLVLSLILLGVGLWLTATFNPRIQSEPLAIILDNQRQLVARIYPPKTGNSPYPAIVLCHGVNSSKEVMAPLAVELARNGIAAITFDLGGYGESYPLPLAAKSEEKLAVSTLSDAQAVVNFAFSHPERFDPNRVGIGGHSLGGTVAQQLAQQDTRIRQVLVISMTPETALPKKADFWFGVGAYEQLNTASDIRAALGDNPAELVVSPTADHITAPYDPFLIQSAVKWATGSRGAGEQRSRGAGEEGSSIYPVSLSPLTPVSFILILGLMMTFAGGIACGNCLLLRLGERLRIPTYSANLTAQLRQVYRYVVSWLIALVMLLVWAMGANNLSPMRGSGNMLIFAGCLQLVSNYALRHPFQVAAVVRVALLYSCLCLGAFFLPVLICGAGEIMSHPVYLTHLPQFLLQWPLFTIYNLVQKLKLELLPAHTLELEPSFLLVFVVWLELIWPGVTLTGLQVVVGRVLGWLRRDWKLTGMGKISQKQLGLITLLLVVLAGAIYQRVTDGLLGVVAANGLMVLQMVGLMVFLPLGIIVVCCRSSWWRRWERWLVK